MKRFAVLIGLVLIFGISTFAQTKRIAHRSHSANLNNYAALEDNDNLGYIEVEDYFNTKSEIDSFYKAQDSLRVRDSIFRVKKIDSLKKLYAPKNVKPKPHKDSLSKKQKTKLIKKDNKPIHKQQSFPFPLLLLIAIPTLVIVFATKYSKYKL